MKSFLHLPATSKDSLITLHDVWRHDIARWALSLSVMMPLLYGIGWLIGSNDPRQGPLNYYVQLFLTENPLVELIMVAAACAIAVGLKPPARFWSTTAVAGFISLLDAPNSLWYIDTSGYLSIFAGILLMICGWRLWDYYEVRKVYAMDEPRLTRPALAAYITLGVMSIILLIPYGN